MTTPDDIALPDPAAYFCPQILGDMHAYGKYGLFAPVPTEGGSTEPLFTAEQLRTAVLEDRKRREALPAGVVIDAYAIQSEERLGNEVRIQRARQIIGPALWKVTDSIGGCCLNKSGEWEWEPSPSNREDDFLARCRFATARDAIGAALAAQEAHREDQA